MGERRTRPYLQCLLLLLVFKNQWTLGVSKETVVAKAVGFDNTTRKVPTVATHTTHSGKTHADSRNETINNIGSTQSTTDAPIQTSSSTLELISERTLLSKASELETSLVTKTTDTPLSIGRNDVTSIPTTTTTSTTDTPTCNLSVTHTSGWFLYQYMDEHKPDFMHITLKFNTSNIRYSNTLIQPLQWVWTPSYGVVNYLKWPYEFPILSLNLLHYKPRKPIDVFFNAYPSDCQIYLGKNSTTLAISLALKNLTRRVVSLSNNTKNAFTKWCYKRMPDQFNETLAYKAAVIIGWYTYLGHYRCCETKYDWWKRDTVISCSAKPIEQMMESDVGPNIVSLILFIFFPLFFVYIYPQRRKKQDKYQLLPVLEHQGHHTVAKEQLKDDYVYLNGDSPIQLSKYFSEIPCLGKNHPFFASRLGRFLCLLVSPVMIYLNIVLFAMVEKDYTDDMLGHNSPMGFLTILSRDHGRHLFAPYCGGPIGVFALYYIFGFILFVSPADISQVLTFEVRESPVKDWSPLWLSLETMQELSCIQLFDACRLSSLCLRLQAHFLMIWRPTFWYNALSCQMNRLKSIYEKCNSRLHKSITMMFLCMAFPLYMVISLLELMLCILYYGLPLVGFVPLIFVAVYRFLKRTFCLRFHPLDVCFVGFIFLMTGSFFFLYAVIFLHSVSLLATFMVFVYIAVIVYPSNAFGYVFFGTAILFYMYKLMSRIGQEYNTLLVDIVDICSRLQAPPCEVAWHDGILKLTIRRSSYVKIERPEIDNAELKLNNETLKHLRSEHDKNNFTMPILIHDAGLFMGIPRHLFDLIIKTHKPLYIHVFKTVLRIVLIISLLSVTVEITNGTGTSGDLSDVMHVVFIVVMGALPHVLDMPHSESTRRVKNEIWLKRIENTIVNYLQNNENVK